MPPILITVREAFSGKNMAGILCMEQDMALAMVVTAMESVLMASAGASTPTGATLVLTAQTLHGDVDMLRALHQWSVRSLHHVRASTNFLVW